MAVARSIRALEGTVLDGMVRVGPAVETVQGTVCEAEPLPGSGISSATYVRFLPERPGEPVLERHLESMYLQHPNLVRCYGAGTLDGPGGRLIYSVLERFDETLADRINANSVNDRDIRTIGLDLAAALTYLHQRNLVCCGLNTSAVVRSGPRWKIADYSQMRVAGSSYVQETRRLLATSPAIPPEAFEGIVSPAWDAWSLASVLVAAASGPRADRPEGRANTRRLQRELPEPVAHLASECLISDPSQRCTVGRIAEMLAVPGDHSGAATTPNAEPVPGSEPPPSADTEAPNDGFDPVETRFRMPEEPRRTWIHTVLAGIGAIVAGAVIAAISLNHDGGREKPSLPAPVSAEGSNPASPAKGVEGAGDSGTADRGGAAATDDTSQIRAVLSNWVAAARARDASAQAAYYAPTVEAFYGARNVSRDWVRRSREKALKNVGQIHRLDVRNVQIHLDKPDHAIVTFDKEWEFGSRYSGRVTQQLAMRKIDDGWRISSERDLRVHNVRPGRTRRKS